MSSRRTITLETFDYHLPPGLIAQQPPANRGSSRLMKLCRQTGLVCHHQFSELPGLLRPGDLLVVNDTKVIPAKFFCLRETGGLVEGLYLKSDRSGCWEVLLKNARRCKPSQRLTFVSPGMTGDPSQARPSQARPGLELVENLGSGRWRVSPEPDGEATEILQQVGQVPLPPYIKRDAGQAQQRADRQRYQTVYAARPGAVAAPTAGLHFTADILAELARMGIETARVTLHVGQGTFEPVKCDDLASHDMHTERFELSAESARAISQAKLAGRRVVAVGTTSVRVLESVAARHGGQVVPDRGETKLFLYPPSDFHVVDALITNFHLPKSTLLMLIASFCKPGQTGGIETILNAYAQAIAHEYRFFSYGDAMLIE